MKCSAASGALDAAGICGIPCKAFFQRFYDGESDKALEKKMSSHNARERALENQMRVLFTYGMKAIC